MGVEECRNNDWMRKWCNSSHMNECNIWCNTCQKQESDLKNIKYHLKQCRNLVMHLLKEHRGKLITKIIHYWGRHNWRLIQMSGGKMQWRDLQFWGNGCREEHNWICHPLSTMRCINWNMYHLVVKKEKEDRISNQKIEDLTSNLACWHTINRWKNGRMT
jgi:hypothetical protein